MWQWHTCHVLSIVNFHASERLDQSSVVLSHSHWGFLADYFFSQSIAFSWPTSIQIELFLQLLRGKVIICFMLLIVVFEPCQGEKNGPDRLEHRGDWGEGGEAEADGGGHSRLWRCHRHHRLLQGDHQVHRPPVWQVCVAFLLRSSEKLQCFRYLRDESGLNRKNIVDNRGIWWDMFWNRYNIATGKTSQAITSFINRLLSIHQ